MDTQQKALLVETGPGQTRGLAELNLQLKRGWQVVQLTPMGGAGSTQASDYCLAALVILERSTDRAGERVETAEEETSEVMREIEEDPSSSSPMSEEGKNGGNQP